MGEGIGEAEEGGGAVAGGVAHGGGELGIFEEIEDIFS